MCWMNFEPFAPWSESANSSALRAPCTFARKEFSYVSSKETLAAQWMTCVIDLFEARELRVARSRGAASRCRRRRRRTSSPSRPAMPHALRGGSRRAARARGPSRPPSSSGRGPSRAGRRETTRSMRRSVAAWERISLPRKPVAPVRRTCSFGLRPRAFRRARASFCSFSMRALTSFSERCDASRNLKKTFAVGRRR